MCISKFLPLFFTLSLLVGTFSSCGQSYDDPYPLSSEEEMEWMMEELSAEELAELSRHLSPEQKAMLEKVARSKTPSGFPADGKTSVRQVNQFGEQAYRGEPSRTADFGTKTVNIVDRGLGKVMFSVEIPNNWQVIQNIATNAYNGQVQSFQLDYTGPNGELVRVVKPATYHPQYGQNFQGVWNQLLQSALGNSLQNLQPSGLQTSQIPLSSSSVRKTMAEYPGNYQGFEQALSGRINGQVYEGRAYIVDINSQMGGIVMATIALAPKGQLNSTLTVLEVMNGTLHSNSDEYRTAISQAGKASLAASAAQHNQRMGQLYAKTNSMYQDLSNLQSQDNADFSRNMRSSGTGYNGNPYTTNDRFNDYIKDTYTIENPYSGIQENVDNQYQYWFINAAGQRRGTNDPNLDLTQVPGGTWMRAPRIGN